MLSEVSKDENTYHGFPSVFSGPMDISKVTDRQRQTETDKDRQRQTETDRDRYSTDRDRYRRRQTARIFA